jgi:aminoglycoside 6'-N-acetyltransferase
MGDSKQVRLRNVRESDLARLFEIQAEPDVARWGIDLTAEELLGASPDGADAITTFVVEANADGSGIVGWICGYEKIEPDYRHAGIDVFLTTGAQGQGVGPEAIRMVCRWLFDERGHHRVVIDPAATNVRAIRAYEKVGFRRVGVMRQYERGPDGTFHDGVLMDLLASDLPVAH